MSSTPRNRHRIRGALAAVALVGVCAGCASSATGTAQPLSDAARTQLQADVLAVSRAISTHNVAGARVALGDLRRDLATLEGAGAVSPDRAARIETVIGELTAALQPTPPPTTRATSVAPKPAPAEPKPPPTKKQDHGGGDHGGGGNQGDG